MAIKCLSLISFVVISTISLQLNKVFCNIYQTYDNCEDSFPQNVVCDPEHILSPNDSSTLRNLLSKMQTDTFCTCPNKQDCYRLTSGTSGYVGGLIIIPDRQSSPVSHEDMKYIFLKSHLSSSESCDNGLLFAFDHSTRQLYTYRGLMSYQKISEEKGDEIINRTLPLLKTDQYANGLRDILNGYLLELIGSPENRWPAISNIVGIIFGCAIAVIAIFAILAVFCYLCCSPKEQHPSSLYSDMNIPPPSITDKKAPPETPSPKSGRSIKPHEPTESANRPELMKEASYATVGTYNPLSNDRTPTPSHAQTPVLPSSSKAAPRGQQQTFTSNPLQMAVAPTFEQRPPSQASQSPSFGKESETQTLRMKVRDH